ncbi:MarR family winged helix-turn-helix transcriptional regulator [Fictibacillus barbaricus]|uniref:DNA-binding MarR family transcriptional regulator n=1 Tax=Fictibacillus barbaricus TaxID=182136 RepID=A0ABU1U3G4_9BACL|nr:MarR family transcriptional regulator [Fictibacillus barbaricus]MDR7073998.1 DNA-binding MarR family transcriptional regulator [Fictibacillus barbaricus]
MDSDLQTQIKLLDHIKDTLFRLNRSFIAKQIKTFSYNLTPTKYSVLKLLFKNEKCMVVDISNAMCMTSGATTTLLNQLEEDGLICRFRDEKDRRVVWIKLSEEGDSLISVIVEKNNQFWEEMLSTLTKEEQNEYIRLLKKIEAGIKID